MKSSAFYVAMFLAVNIYDFTVVLAAEDECEAEKEEPWSYRGQNGPPYWATTYSQCNGTQQSPIAIYKEDTIKDTKLAKLTLNNYKTAVSKGTILNSGHTVQLTPGDNVKRTISVNGDEYTLQQLHFHWGNKSDVGSEHVLDNIRYAMEMHLVHTNSNNNISVVGIFFKEQDGDNAELKKFVSQLPDVKYKSDKVALKSSINLNKLLPANPTSYYRYGGSLTTPGCAEGVIWSVLPNPVPVGKAQMQEFRKLYAVEKENAMESCHIVNNYRPLQNLSGRTVYASK